MKNFVGFTLGCLFAFLSSGITPLMAQDAAVNELVITGTVKNKDSRKKLENVNVSVVGNNIGTVTNADGTFSLKVAEADNLGYRIMIDFHYSDIWADPGRQEKPAAWADLSFEELQKAAKSGYRSGEQRCRDIKFLPEYRNG